MIDPEEIADDQRFAALLADARAKALAALPDDAVAALAAAPFWTAETLAGAGVDAALVTSAGRALLQRDGVDPDAAFALAPDALALALARIAKLRELEPMLVVLTLGIAGNQLHLASTLLETVAAPPPAIARWAELAAALQRGVDAAAQELVDAVRAACDRGEPGAATLYIEAAAPLARVVGRELAVAERLCRHRIEREFRAIRDRKQLASYVERAEAKAALDTLLGDGAGAGGAAPWALHYLGVGGAGKTTFIRHLAHELAAAGTPVARIDFDYLSPAYPARDPGELVEAIVHELTVHIDRPEQDRWYQAIAEQLERLRELTRDAPTDDPVAPIHSPAFQELLSFLSSFLTSLGRPLVIFDTCEELMKLPAVGRTIPSVEATFALIEELRARIPELRVIFAGRRLLAQGGAGWTAAPQAIDTQPLSARRPYLALHELRGMPEDEARAMLALLLPDARKADAALAAGILAASPEGDRVATIAGDDAGPRRYSPYRIARFGRWVAAEPTLALDQVSGRLDGADPYIEQRVVQRMGALGRLLPVIVQLRRFDAETLAAVRGATLTDAEATVEALAGHEWIYVSSIAGRGTVVEIKGTIRGELVAYLQRKQPAAWAEARAAIGAALGPRLRAAGAVTDPPEIVDAALRALPEAAAAAAWQTLEANVGADWGSALTLTRFLGGDDNAGAELGGLVDAAIRATQISAILHEQPALDVGAAWREIGAALERLAQTGVVMRLRGRALLGRIAADAWRGMDDGAEAIRTLRGAALLVQGGGGGGGTAVATATIAALEGIVESCERSYVACDGLAELGARELLASVGGATPGLDAFALALDARIAELAGDRGRVRQLCADLAAGAAWDLPATCIDWKPPASLRDRVLLERLRLQFWDADVSPTSPVTVGGSVDADRFQSAYAQYVARSVISPLPPAWPTPAHYELGVREPAVYRRFPPHAVALAQLDWTADAIPESIDPANRLRIGWARARRRRDPSLMQSNAQFTTGRLKYDEARAAAVVLGRTTSMALGIAFSIHSLAEGWSYQRGDTALEIIRGLAHFLVDALRYEDLTAIEAYLLLDEYRTLKHDVLAPPPDDAPLARAHPDQMKLAIRLGLRLAARETPFALPAHTAAAAKHAPELVAMLAIDEAELLALRLPARAADMFAFARDLTRDDAVRQLAALGHADCRYRMGPIVGAAPIMPTPDDVPPALTGFARQVSLLSEERPREPTADDKPHARPPVVMPPLAPAPIGGRKGGRTALVAGAGTTGLAGVAFASSQIGAAPTFGTLGFMLLLVVLWYLTQRRRTAESPQVTGGLPGTADLPMPTFRITERNAEVRIAFSGIAAAFDGTAVTVPQPKPGIPPARYAELDAVRDDLRGRGDRLLLVRLDVDRSLHGHAWEPSIVGDLPHAVAWRAILCPAAPRLALMATRLAGVQVDWEAGTGQPLDAILGVIHVVARPRRTLATVLLETGDKTESLDITGPVDVVLQLARQDASQASAGSRTELGQLRELAESLVERGASSVLVIPAIARAHSSAVVRALAKAMGAATNRSLATLAEGARACRAALAAIDDGEHRLVADEVTLFVRRPT